MKKKKSKKKLVIGVGILVVAVVAGVNIYGSMNAADSAIPQVKTVSAVRDNVQQTVEISGTVVSEEQKTYFSPVNAKVDTAALKEGETVKAGSSLIEFDQKDLEREAKKADLNVESGKLDMKNTLKKSDEAVRKQQNAAGDAVIIFVFFIINSLSFLVLFKFSYILFYFSLFNCILYSVVNSDYLSDKLKKAIKKQEPMSDFPVHVIYIVSD